MIPKLDCMCVDGLVCGTPTVAAAAAALSSDMHAIKFDWLKIGILSLSLSI